MLMTKTNGQKSLIWTRLKLTSSHWNVILLRIVTHWSSHSCKCLLTSSSWRPSWSHLQNIKPYCLWQWPAKDNILHIWVFEINTNNQKRYLFHQFTTKNDHRRNLDLNITCTGQWWRGLPLSHESMGIRVLGCLSASSRI